MNPRRAVLVGVLILGGGCGVTTQDRARTVGPADVPFGLAEDAPRSATTLLGGTSIGDVFLLDEEGRLVAAPRRLARADPASVVAVLLAGATEEEVARGLSSALEEDHLISAIDVAGGIAIVDLGRAFAELDGASQRRALAQIVYTLTARPGIGRVTFTLDAQPVEIPTGDGALTTGSVSRDSYRSMEAP